MSSSFEDISFIYLKEKNETSESDNEDKEKSESCSLPSLPIALQNQLDSPEKNLKSVQAMTMKEIDCKLSTLRRENFDLKLRLYLEKQNKGINKPEGEALISKEFVKREKALRACRNSLLEKKQKIKDLKNQVEELEKNKNFEIGLLKNENDVLVNNLSIVSTLCKTFVNHLNEIKKFWEQFLNDSNNHKNKKLINSFAQWFNISQSLVNNASIFITDDNNISRSNLHDMSPKFKGMSSLGLLTDLSELIPKTEKKLNITFENKLDQSIQTEIDNQSSKKYYQKMENIILKNVLTQTVYNEDEQKIVIEKSSQTDLLKVCEKKIQTQFESKENFSQTITLTQETKTQTDSTEMVEIGVQSLMSTISIIGSSPVARSKSVSKGYKSEVLKKLNNAQFLNIELTTEKVIPSENDKHLEKNKDFFKLPNEKMFAKVRKNNRLKTKSQDQKENEVVEPSSKEKVQTNGSLSSNHSTDFGKKNDLINKISNKVNKIVLSKEKRLDTVGEKKKIEKYLFPELEINDSNQDLSSSLRAYIKLSYYQLLRTNLNSISFHLNLIENLNNDRFVLQLIKDNEYLEKFKLYLSNLHQTMFCSKNIFSHFLIEDENSILAQFEKIKVKKENMEKAISHQLRKTDKLLKKAKINLKD